jgi:hypothetical protein
MYTFLTASKDATIYFQQPTQNTGLDEILEISKTYYGNSKDVAHTLIKFETNTLNDIIIDESTLLSSSLHIESKSLYENKLIVNAASSSWSTAVSSSLYYSASYKTYSQSLSTYINYSESYDAWTSAYNEASNSIYTLSSSIVDSNLVNVSQSYARYSEVSSSYNILSSSVYSGSNGSGSIVDISLLSTYNTLSSSYNTLSASYSASHYTYLISSGNLSNEITELNTLYGLLINSSSNNLTSASLYNSKITASGSWNQYVVQSLQLSSSYNVLSSSYNVLSSSLVNDITNGIYTFDYSAELILKECEANEIPIDYVIYAYPISQSWDMGIGTRFDDISTDGVTWNHRRTSTDWVTDEKFITGSVTGSYNGKGGVWYTGSATSQSFSYQSTDINMNVKSMFTSWLSGSLVNEGILLKHSTILENDTEDYGQLKFFSKETNTIYQPKVRIGWNDQSFVTGSLTQLTSDDIHVTFKKLKTKYKVGSTPEIGVFAREKYPLKTYSNTFAYNDIKYLPSTTYYQIKDVITDEIIVPFSDYTKVSCNSNGNYFKLNLTNWETNRSYYVEIKIDRSGVIEYFSDKDLTFTIEK